MPFVALFDGHCRFCEESTRALLAVVGPSRLVLRSFHEAGSRDGTGLTVEACMAQLHVVAPDGRVFGGAEAVARVLMTLPVVGVLFALYYLPGLRRLADAVYVRIARARYRLRGRARCDGGTCHLHV